MAQVKTAVARAHLLMLMLKTKGGWKWRKDIRLSDLELAERLPLVELEVNTLAIRLAVAETFHLGWRSGRRFDSARAHQSRRNQ